MNENILSKVPLFSSLPDEELQRLVQSMALVKIPSSTVLIREGESGDSFYVLVSGEVEIVKALETVNEKVIATRGPGDFLGEISLLNRDLARTASVKAVTDLQLLELNRADFEALLHRYPLIAYEMVRVLGLRLNSAQDVAMADLIAKNRELAHAYEELKASQAQIIEKEKLEHELHMAHQIQMSILPHRLPDIPGYCLGSQIVPARAVGGDFFDFIPLHGGLLGLAIGDVADKGVPSAIFMAQTHALLRAEAKRAASPRQALERVNDHLMDMNEAGVFVTALYGVLEPGTGAFHYARAGHELPMLLLMSGEVIVAGRGNGMVLGVFPGSPLDENTIMIPGGATLLFYTDGATDILDPNGVAFGIERLTAAFSATARTPAQQVCDRLLEALQAHQGDTPQADDITLVAISKTI
jgi:sigma-B regulation protein RsbU (phosphoserine phosphatase)